MKENLMETEITGEDFAGMLEQSLKTLNTGDTVTGLITSISSGEIHVDLGAKSTGIIPRPNSLMCLRLRSRKSITWGMKSKLLLLK